MTSSVARSTRHSRVRPRQAARGAGVPQIRLHDLRHTGHARAHAGVHPKVVSERLGHATTSITLDLYSHVQPTLDAEAATVVAQLFVEPAGASSN